MMASIWAVVILFAGISVFTGDPASLIAGLILSVIGIFVERFSR